MVRYPCDPMQSEQKGTKKIRYLCVKCDYPSTSECDLKRHSENKQEGVTNACFNYIQRQEQTYRK